MKYLKDLTQVDESEFKTYLSTTPLWDTPLRFINEASLSQANEQAVSELGGSKAKSIMELIRASLTMAKFLGLIEHSQVATVKQGS